MCSVEYWLLQLPQSYFPLNPACQLPMLCIYIAKFRRPKIQDFKVIKHLSGLQSKKHGANTTTAITYMH